MGRERRKHDRKKVDISCELEVEATGARGAAHIAEMGVGGCFVDKSDTKTFGSTVCLRFHLDGGSRELALTGIVRWTSERGMGVQFLAVGVAALTALTHHLLLREPASLPPPNPDVQRPPALRPAADKAAAVKRWQEARQRDRRYAQARVALRSSEPSQPPVSQREEPAASASDDRNRHLERVAALETTQHRLEAELIDLRTALAQRDQQLAHATAMLEERVQQVQALRDTLHERDERLRRDELLKQQCPVETGDDLTRIRGIGPRFAEALRGAGITRFAQMAAWSDENIDAIADRLGTSGGRIRNGSWVESAAALIARKDIARKD